MDCFLKAFLISFLPANKSNDNANIPGKSLGTFDGINRSKYHPYAIAITPTGITASREPYKKRFNQIQLLFQTESLALG